MVEGTRSKVGLKGNQTETIFVFATPPILTLIFPVVVDLNIDFGGRVSFKGEVPRLEAFWELCKPAPKIQELCICQWSLFFAS